MLFLVKMKVNWPRDLNEEDGWALVERECNYSIDLQKSSVWLLLCGVSTNGVVSAAVREGHDRDYVCTVLEDCCAGATSEEHEHALAGLHRYSQITTAAECDY